MGTGGAKSDSVMRESTEGEGMGGDFSGELEEEVYAQKDTRTLALPPQVCHPAPKRHPGVGASASAFNPTKRCKYADQAASDLQAATWDRGNT